MPEALPWLASVEEAAGGYEALLGREPERTPALLALSERLTSPQASPYPSPITLILSPNPSPNPTVTLANPNLAFPQGVALLTGGAADG